MKNRYHKKLFLGPMSKNVVDAIIDFNKINDNFFGIIPSRRQIECAELGSGYVNNWSTKDFKKYVSDSLILRDHGGPNQGKKEDDGKLSFLADINSGIDFLHIDPWKTCKSIDEGILKTTQLIKYCLSINSDCRFEVGTEEAIYQYSPGDLEKIIMTVQKSLGSKFDNIVYCVVQSGTSIRGIENTGNFNYKKSKDMSAICKKFGILAKEHNTDYLSNEAIKLRINAGIDSLNIAPELGVIETCVILKELDNHRQLKEEFLNMCNNSKKWKKWVDEKPDNKMIARICGHYLFSTKEFKNIKMGLTCSLDKTIKAKITEKLVSLSDVWKV